MKTLINQFYEAKFSGDETLATELQIRLFEKLKEFADTFGCDPITYYVEKIMNATSAISCLTSVSGDHRKSIQRLSKDISTYTRIIDFINYHNTL